MAKKNRDKSSAATGENPRRPCPCGSGKRYKACHGAGDDVIVTRPFEGLAAEPDLVAMREFLPSAVAPLPLRETGERAVRLATVLPGASAALVRPNGEILLGMQVQTRSGDLSADLTKALRWAEAAEPGSALPVVGPGVGEGEVVRLQDLLVADAELDLELHQDFAWWLPADGEEPGAEIAATIERANSVIMPTEALGGEGVRAAYWVDTGTKAHVRWVRPEAEDALMPALARLQAAGELDLGEGSRYAGAFRAHGLLVPVWDVDREMHAKEWAAPAVAFAKRLSQALASTDELTPAERSARDALAGKQITLR
ncbi:DUF5926 family protein [Pseudonocardia halophobica]|uniref:DUF5926 domain-containing protein n=1 Tax=Pseudonocardia halophobica TaxID=29401 RepID=A0A9W6KYM9_9PSEU|nr:DUF5926 family protein [Pseudonocardia halophobica]GLL08961.1 hypothetical protein GCM10017577_01010 [Pseudonocardia halophobica]